MPDGRVMLSFRCSCAPTETVNEYVDVHEAGHAVDLLCPRCKRQLVQVRASLLLVPGLNDPEPETSAKRRA
jgi:hypothetical protein